MGFLAGVVSEINRQEDAATRASEFMQQLLEKRKNAILPELMGRIKARTDKANSRAARVSKGVSFGMSQEAASVLESAGQLENALIPLQKLNDDPEKSISADNIAALNEAVIANVPPEKVAGALTYALDNGYAENPSSDLLIEAIYANTEEDFEAALTPLMERASAPGKASPMSGSGFKINPRSLTGVSDTNLSAAQKNIEKQLLPILGGSYNAESGNILWTNPEAAGRIVNTVVHAYVNQMTDVMIQRDANEVINSLQNNVQALKAAGNTLGEIANFSENIFVDVSQAPIPQTPPPPPLDGPPSVLPSSAEEDMFNTENLNIGG